MKINLVLVENDHALLGKLEHLLSFYNGFNIIGRFSSVDDAIGFTRENETDAVFANVAVGDGRTSSDISYLTAILACEDPDIQTVIYSAQAGDAYGALLNHCTDFFTLPFEPLAMQRVVGHLTYLHDLLQYKRESLNRSIMIKTKKGYCLMPVNEILFVERSDRKNKIVTEDGQETILSGYTMDEIERILGKCDFYRCYQSFIVNLSKISFISVDNETKNYTIRFKHYRGEIILSRSKYTEVVALLKNKYSRLSM